MSLLDPITLQRFARFRRHRAGWWSLLALLALSVLALLGPLLVGHRPLILQVDGVTRFPVFAGYLSGRELGLKIEGEPLPVEERAPREPRAGGADFERRPSRERTPMTTGERVEGTVKFFNGTKGFGFIQRDDGAPDAFVHISAVERAGFSNLNEGQRVSFELEEDRRGKEAAVNLSAI